MLNTFVAIMLISTPYRLLITSYMEEEAGLPSESRILPYAVSVADL